VGKDRENGKLKVLMAAINKNYRGQRYREVFLDRIIKQIAPSVELPDSHTSRVRGNGRYAIENAAMRWESQADGIRGTQIFLFPEITKPVS
jgi:hypothetical protein